MNNENAMDYEYAKVNDFFSVPITQERFIEIQEKAKEVLLENFKNEINRILNENSDNFNAFDEDQGTCVYSDGKGNYCIIGKYLLESGILKEDEIYGLTSIDADAVMRYLGFTDDISSYASRVQAIADDGCTVWSKVLLETKELW